MYYSPGLSLSWALSLKRIIYPGYLILPYWPVISLNNVYAEIIFLFLLSFFLRVSFFHASLTSCYTQQSQAIWFSFPVRLEMVGELRKGASFELVGGANVVRMESVTQSIGCWWLRAVSAVRGEWFMDAKWTLVSKTRLRVLLRSNWGLFLATACLHFLLLFMPKYFARQLALSSFRPSVPEG